MAKSELVVSEEPLQPVAAQQSKYLSLIEMSIEKGADLVQIEKFMDLQERYEANEAKKQFNYAMSVFQSALPIIEKKGLVNYTSTKGTTNYNYARLEDIAQAIRPALKLSGLSYRFTQEQNAGQIKVTCIVTHIDGHSEESSLHSNPDLSGGKDPLKAMASAISYLRRYTLTGLLGIVVGGEDDDAGSAGGLVDGEQKSDCYPDEDFNKHFPNWEKAILSRKKTPDQIVANGNKQGITFSQDQLNKINKVGNA